MISVEAYIRDGYTVVAGAIEPSVLGTVRRELRRFAVGRLPVENPRDSSLGDDAALASVLAVNHPHRVSAAIRSTIAHPALVETLSRIAGAHIAHWDGSIKHAQSMLYHKPPGHLGQPWHQDELFLPTRDRSLTGAWVAVDDTEIANGCLWVIPGSHKMGYLWPTRLTQDKSEYVLSDESHGFDTREAIPVEVEPAMSCFSTGTSHLRRGTDRRVHALR